MESIEEARVLVLAFAAELGRRCVESVRAGDLRRGLLEDELTTDDVIWKLAVWFDSEAEVLRISGRPEVKPKDDPEEDEQMLMPPWMAQMFGQQEMEGAFDFTMPVVWLPTGDPPEMMGA